MENQISLEILKNLVSSEEKHCSLIGKLRTDHRAKMVDWMIKVLGILKSSDRTIFLAICLFDRFWAKASPKIEELHISGVTSMYIASKFLDKHPLRLSVVFENIVHRSISLQDLRNYEKFMLFTLEFKVKLPTSIEVLGALQMILKLPECLVKNTKEKLLQMLLLGNREVTPSQDAVSALTQICEMNKRKDLIVQIRRIFNIQHTQQCIYNY